jgi:hypothetical protein
MLLMLIHQYSVQCLITYVEVHEWMATANLLIMISALTLIALSMFFERKKKWVWHGNTMLLIMTITGLLVVVHMGPSLVSAIVDSLKGLDLVAVTGVIHGLIGFFALFSGLWLVAVWAYVQSGNSNFCMAKKKWMWRILTLWLLSLGLGILYYLLHITVG